MYTLYFCFRFEDDAYQRSNMLLLPLSLKMIPKRRFPTYYIHNMNFVTKCHKSVMDKMP